MADQSQIKAKNKKPVKGYQCAACSHVGRRFPKGVCPACGSANIQRLNPKEESVEEQSSWRLFVCIALWIYIAYELYRKLS